jgi:uncharacterized membrane protein YesL
VCCLPVITIGAAWTACYAHILRLVRRQETGLPLRTYFADFKKALRTATPAWLLTLLCALIVAGDYYFAVYASNPPNRFFLVFSIVMAAVLLFAAVWLYPLMARYENTVRGHIENAVLLAAGSFPKTLLASAVQLAFFALPLFVPDLFYYFGWLWLMGGLSLPLYLTARIFRKELACVPTPEDEAQAERMEPQENRED